MSTSYAGTAPGIYNPSSIPLPILLLPLAYRTSFNHFPNSFSNSFPNFGTSQKAKPEPSFCIQPDDPHPTYKSGCLPLPDELNIKLAPEQGAPDQWTWVFPGKGRGEPSPEPQAEILPGPPGSNGGITPDTKTTIQLIPHNCDDEACLSWGFDDGREWIMDLSETIAPSFKDAPLWSGQETAPSAANRLMATRMIDQNGNVVYRLSENNQTRYISEEEYRRLLSLHFQAWLEYLYPEYFGPRLAAGGGWHQWHWRVRKVPRSPGTPPSEPPENLAEAPGDISLRSASPSPDGGGNPGGEGMSEQESPAPLPSASGAEGQPASDRFWVEASKSDDSSIVTMSPEDMRRLSIFRGDTVLLTGKLKKTTVAILLSEQNQTLGTIKMHRSTRSNLKLSLGDPVRVTQMPDIKYGKRVHILPTKESIAGITGNLFDVYLKPFFNEAYRPVTKGDIIPIRAAMRTVEFRVMETDPVGSCIVSPDTVLYCEGEPVDRQDESSIGNIGYDDIGGLGPQIRNIREIIELPLRYPQLFYTLNASPAKGILLTGPPGTGKTMIARATANESGAFFFLINGPEILSKMSGESESNLRKAFDEAQKNAPAIIFIDEIDSIAPKRDKTQGEVERRIVAQLLTLMDGLLSRHQVIVLAATNRANSIDQALRRFGRFDKEIHIGVPDEVGRLEILQVHTRDKKLSDDVDLETIAKSCHGFTGADIAQLISDAAVLCIRQKVDITTLEDGQSLDAELLDSLEITHAHFEQALGSSSPSALRETYVEIPAVTWEDIGGMAETKKTLNEMVRNPLEFPGLLKHFGQKTSRGVLLYGPPGCGKTQLAKALANDCQANFISIKGPELLTMWFGESERNVRDLFEKARQSAPCILFFDEIDSLATNRGGALGDANGASDRVLNQLLTEIDGITERNQIYIIAATNRPDILDPAIMRPGRFDKHIYIPLPDYESRLHIFKAVLRKTPVQDNVDLRQLARATPSFSGADISEVCQTAIRHAVREYASQRTSEGAGSEPVKAEESLDNYMLTRSHFEQAMLTARRSVKPMDMRRYENFQAYKEGQTGIPFRFQDTPAPENGTSAGSETVPGEDRFYEEEEDDDLYD
ncbi:AAA family ATPase [Endozoicomonas sp. 4G]|uniref:AAA family ATPase n=1 Tax=Endozoicomonas sp. 4G TaxID=2872754 RepID=UPI00207867EE|nr:AAA family ATPase [Endozoicomonas sp. 4G]